MRFTLTGIFVLFAIACSFAQVDRSIRVDAPPFQGIKDDVKLSNIPPVPEEQQQQFEQAIKDVHFDFDQAVLRDEDRRVLEQDAAWLKSHPNVLIALEGNADDRGDIVYNVVLSGERAETTRQALLRMGIPNERIAFSTGWGKLYPVCTQSSEESCLSQNRRTHITTWPPEEEAGSPSIALAQ